TYVQSTKLEGHMDGITSVAFSVNGDCLASDAQDRTTRLWGVRAGIPITPPKGHKKEVTWVSISPSTALIASGFKGRTVRLWDSHTWTHVAILAAHGAEVHFVASSPSGDRFTSVCAKGETQLWDTPTWTHVSTIKGAWIVNPIAFSPKAEYSALQLLKRSVDHVPHLAAPPHIVSSCSELLSCGSLSLMWRLAIAIWPWVQAKEKS
ncbi:hypothetical protein FRB97_006911, partial [Tulasnella sp. 331]